MKSFSKLLLGLLLTINLAPLSFAQDVAYPSASGYVVDQSGIMDAGTKSRLEAWILELKQKTTAEVAVVTVDSTEPLSIEEYAVNLFQRFGIGQKGKDNGVLLLVAYKDHHMRIEVGYGLEGAITDAYSSQIINSIMSPKFKQGNFSDGIEKGTAAIVTLIAKEYNVTLIGVPEPNYQTSSQSNDSIWFAVFFFIFFMVFAFRFNGRNFVYGPGGFSSGMGGGGFSGGGGGFSGGFGGFGGGGSGGGGASGGW
jgi:uncharacterized protein